MRRLLLLALLACGVHAPTSGAAPRAGTFAWNYKNRPVVAPLEGYESVAVSPRGILAPGVADSLECVRRERARVAAAGPRGHEGRAGLGTGVPVRQRRARLSSSATTRSSHKPNGKPVQLFPGKTYGALVLDYRDSAFVDEYAALIASTFRGKARGVLLDYGCGDISWAHLGVDDSVWPAWRRGFIRLCERLRAQASWSSSSATSIPTTWSPCPTARSTSRPG